MKNLKLIAKTLFFSLFMTTVISTAGNTVCPAENATENSIQTCCEEYPDLSPSDSIH